MQRSGHDFTCIVDLPRGKHAYRFIVDDKLQCDETADRAQDRHGGVHNIINLREFKTHDETEKIRQATMKRTNTMYPNSSYDTSLPDMVDFGGEPPPQLPPHLRHIILNHQDKITDDLVAASFKGPMDLPKPETVTLNHLYCTAVKHGLMVLGTTSRYKDKFVTSVFYSKAELR